MKDEDKPRAQQALEAGKEALAELQDMLYAHDRWSVLLIFQAMDAAGKDSAIKHVMSGVNPQGCQVFSFKQPSTEELDHDWLWRCWRALPERGRIGIFNRSYYEEVLVVKVHPQFLASQKLPDGLIHKGIWDERYKDIRAFERHLARNGTLILKFFLNVSKDEQKKRFLERIDEPSKNWKFSAERRQRARALEGIHGRVPVDDPRNFRHRMRRGTSCPPTTSGTRASSSRRRLSTDSLRSTCAIRSSTRRSSTSLPRRRRCCWRSESK